MFPVPQSKLADWIETQYPCHFTEKNINETKPSLKVKRWKQILKADVAIIISDKIDYKSKL